MHTNFKALLIFLLLYANAYGDYTGPFSKQAVQPVLEKFNHCKSDTSRIQLMLQLSDLYFYRANRNEVERDSALFYANAAQKLAALVNFDKGLAMAYFQQAAILPLINFRENGKKAIVKASEIFLLQKNYRMLGESYFRQGGFFSLSGNEFPERIKYTMLSLDAFRKGGYTAKQAEVMQAIGELYFLAGNSRMALPYLKQSLQTYQSIKHKDLTGIYDLLGTLYTYLGAPEQGLKYGLLALRTAQTLKDTSQQVSTIYNRIGMTYYNLHEYRKSCKYYAHGLEISKKLGDILSIHILASNLANSHLRLKNFEQAIQLLNTTQTKYPARDLAGRFFLDRIYVNIYKDLKQYDKAEKYIDELIRMVSSPTSTVEYSERIYHLLVEFYLETGDYGKAAEYIKLHKVIANRLHYAQMRYLNLLWQSKLDSANHDYSSALNHYRQYSVLKDSVFNDQKARQASQFEIIYETEKKEENIRSLRKESVLQKNMLSQAVLVQNVTYTSILLLLIVIFLLVYGYRLVKRNNKALAIRQQEIDTKNDTLGRLLVEKEWLMKEIHHRVKNNLHMIVGLLESQAEFLKSDEAKAALAESEHRIQSMSMIHQKLYQTDNLTCIEISAYIHELVQYLSDSFERACPVKFNLDIERFEFNVSHAIPLGLILNEVIINSLKYAFPDSRNGNICVSLKQTRLNHFVLTISDDGIGLGPNFQIDRIDSFGLTLIMGLCEDLEAEFDIQGRQGTSIQISFDYAPQEINVEHL